MTKAAVALSVLALCGCGPSDSDRSAERDAYGALLDRTIKALRDRHACDAEWKTYREAGAAALEALKSNNDKLYSEFSHERERADVKHKACESALTPYQTTRQEVVRLGDTWMDACLKCASGAACIATFRRLRDLKDDDPAQTVRALEEMKRVSVCGKRPRTG